MEALQRSVMLLRPGDSSHIEPGKSGGALKMLSKNSGVDLSFKTDCLKEGDYFLYLFTSTGKELYAGDLTDGTLITFVSGVPVESITGAAVVARDKGGGHTFCLKSTRPDWPALIERFKLRRAPRIERQEVPAPPKSPPHADYPPEVTLPPHEPYPGYRTEDAAPGVIIPPEVSAPSKEAYADYPQEPASAFSQDVSSIVFDEAEPEPAEERLEGVEEESCDACPHAVRENNINPFPSVFPNSEWVKISYPGPTGWWHYISGKIYKGGVLAAKALGVPGEYGMAPPIWLEGFGTYLRCFTGDARGYWIMFQDAETGEVLDMGLSPHGG